MRHLKALALYIYQKIGGATTVVKIVCNVLLITGAFTSGTAAFKAIPLLTTLWPLNLITIPGYIVAFICWSAFISGFTVFYSTYNEALLKVCYNVINWFTKQNNKQENEPTIQELESKLQPIQEAISVKTAENELLIEIITKHLTKKHSLTIPDPFHSKLTAKLEALKKPQHITKPQDIKKPQHIIDKSLNRSLAAQTPIAKNKWVSALKTIINFLIEAISYFLILLGFIVVVGIGILTNQGALIYYGVNITNSLMLCCFVAAMFKQLCQLSISASKQHQMICNFFRTIFHIPIKKDSEVIQKALEQQKKELVQDISSRTETQETLKKIHKELEQMKLEAERLSANMLATTEVINSANEQLIKSLHDLNKVEPEKHSTKMLETYETINAENGKLITFLYDLNKFETTTNGNSEQKAKLILDAVVRNYITRTNMNIRDCLEGKQKVILAKFRE